MAYFATLLPDPADCEALRRAASEHTIIRAASWRELTAIIRRQPVTLVVADPHAEPRKDGVLRIFRLHESFPYTPLLAWGELDGRDLYRLGKAGAANVILAHDADNTHQVTEIFRTTLRSGVPRFVEAGLANQLQGDAIELVRFAARMIPARIQVPDLALAHGTSVSTLERRCERWGIPTPGRLLLWLRVLYGLYWLAEPGRSLESVADQLGYSSGAAFRRALQATSGSRGVPPRTYRSFHAALQRFLAECPGRSLQQITPRVLA